MWGIKYSRLLENTAIYSCKKHFSSSCSKYLMLLCEMDYKIIDVEKKIFNNGNF